MGCILAHSSLPSTPSQLMAMRFSTNTKCGGGTDTRSRRTQMRRRQIAGEVEVNGGLWANGRQRKAFILERKKKKS